jgi:hypothetical protein
VVEHVRASNRTGRNGCPQTRQNLDFAATCYRCKHRPGSSRGSIPLRPQGLCACAAGVSARIRRYRRPEFTQVKALRCSKINDLLAGGQPWWPAPANRSGGRRLRYFDLWCIPLVVIGGGCANCLLGSSAIVPDATRETCHWSPAPEARSRLLPQQLQHQRLHVVSERIDLLRRHASLNQLACKSSTRYTRVKPPQRGE